MTPGVGNWAYWIEPINAAGLAGPREGPFYITIG
jgi:hypothetical protein